MCPSKRLLRNKRAVCKQGWSSLAQGPEPAEWGEESEGKGDKPRWACSAEPLAAVQAEVLDTVHRQASCQGICTARAWLRQDFITKIVSILLLSY